ncbi:MAG: LacI family DNA-binding transcriptional regulator [Microbacterium sp.]
MTTIQDVARRAGVSPATVSRFLSGHPVRSTARITEAIADLHYRPNNAARSLRSGLHSCIALIVPDVTNPFFASVLKGIENRAGDERLLVLVGNSDEDPVKEAALIQELAARSDGMIIGPVKEGDESYKHLAGLNMPIVLIDREIGSEHPFDSVVADNQSGMRQAVGHLVGLGHTRIAAIHGPEDSTPGRTRIESFHQALRERHIEIRSEYNVMEDFRIRGGYDGMMALWDLTERPTAVIISNNLMTAGALTALHEMAVSVPGDLSVIGFDDQQLAPLLDPPLTVVRRNEIEQGALAADLLIRRLRMEERGEYSSLTMPVDLVIRSSTATPRDERHRPQDLKERAQ